MLPQRACAAESQVKHRSSNGPLRVQGTGRRKLCPQYSATCGHTSVAGDMMVSRKSTASWL
ncbi:MAG: hypothetical protein E7631_01540 [Ruminococcaceae bacterium]|nr:hypothetical protein [Oscillospiraceae bacterium]